MRDLWSVTWKLVLLMVVAGLCLGLTNAITQEPIAQQELITAQTLRKAVLPAADDFSDLSITDNNIQAVYEGVSGGQTQGYVFEVVSNGFGGEIKLTVGVDASGVTGVRIASHSETPGLGANADKESFLSQYEGKNGEVQVIKSGTPKDNEIMAVTAATISSRAVTRAVNEALDYYQQNLA